MPTTPKPNQNPLSGIQALLTVMQQLRDPKNGCPWDLEQTFESIAPYTIEEAYEVADALSRGNMADFKEELGDLLLQVVFQSQIASEQNLFDINDVAQSQAEKLISRHPHIFGDQTAHNANAVIDIWNTQKDKENAAKGKNQHYLDSVTTALPALMRGQKIYKRVAKLGFDWPHINDVFAKLDEETAELRQAMSSKARDNIVEEFGDMLFVMCVLAGHLGIDAEESLRQANYKFTRRFNAVEDLIKAEDKELDKATLPDMEDKWQQVKKQEKQAS